MHRDEIEALVDRAASQVGAWEAAGYQRRLETVLDACRRIDPAALEAALRDGGLSRHLAHHLGRDLCELLATDTVRYHARTLVRSVRTARGHEILLRRPVGVVAVIAPANAPAPVAIPILYTLLAGNAVVVRAPVNPHGLGYLLAAFSSALVEHGFDPALISSALGPTRDILPTLLDSPAISTIVFFGNSTAAARVADAAHARGKRLVLELEGSDHSLIWRDAPLAEAVASTSEVWNLSTQACLLPKVALVHDGVFDAFAGAMVANARAITTCAADPESGRLLPLGKPEAFDQALDEIRGVGEILCGGHRMRADGERDAGGAYAAPTIVALRAEEVRRRPLAVFREEIFFPLLPLVRFDGPDDLALDAMLDFARSSPFGLRLSAWATDPRVLARAARAIDGVGLIKLNERHAAPAVAGSSWGGPKRTGGLWGENHIFLDKVTTGQAIRCGEMSESLHAALWEALGVPPDVTEESGPGVLAQA